MQVTRSGPVRHAHRCIRLRLTVTEVVHRFILRVVGDAVGLPKEGRQHLLIFGELAMNLPGPLNSRYERALARVEKWIEFAGEPVPFANNAMSTYGSLPLRFIPA